MTEPVLEVKSLNVRFIDENGGLFSAVFNSSFCGQFRAKCWRLSANPARGSR